MARTRQTLAVPPVADDWDLSCPDWEARLRDGRSLVPTLPLDPKEAARAVGIFNKLRLYDVMGNPTMGEVGGDWFRDIIAAMFGSIDETGVRRVRGLFCLVPKKNAKTTNSAGLMLTALLMNNRPSAEFLLTAPSQEISEKAFATAKGMIALDPDGYLQKRFHVRDHIKQIDDRATKAILKIKTFDEDIVTGAVVAGAMIDEIHLLGKKHRAAAIIQQLRGGMVSTPEAFFAMITTQSFDPPTGVFRAELHRARAVRDGAAKIDTLPVLYEFSEKQQKNRTFWENPNNWGLVTPNLGRSIRIPRLVKDLAEAKIDGEEAVRVWASQHLNIEIGLALHSDRWSGANHWEAATEPGLTLDALLERSEVVVMGGDGGGLDDLLGWAVLGRERGTRKWLLWCRAWCFAGVLDLRKSEAPLLLDLERAGELGIAQALGTDMAELAEIAKKVLESDKLPAKGSVGLDPAGIGGIVDALNEAGITGEQIVGVSQGWRLSGAIGTTERALADGTLKHAGQRLMAWCVGNAKIEPRGNAKLITKQASGTGKIDPLMAAFNAISLMSMNPPGTDTVGFVDLSKGAL